MVLGMRKERDFLGSVNVPDNVYYGSFTARALDNFKISGNKVNLELIKALILVKRCAARVNIKNNIIDKRRGNSIIKACNEALKGKFDDYFCLDVYQAGAGTPINMNVNEVIANRASEIIGSKMSSYLVHPNNHVNASQSSNDVVPTAIKIAVLNKSKHLILSLKNLEKSFLKKSGEFKDVLKVGRTHMRDAVPTTLGIEFKSYASLAGRDYENIIRAVDLLREVHIGGTAIGSGINTHPRYKELIIKELNKETKLGLCKARDYFELAYNVEHFVNFSNSLRILALNLIKICDDLKFLSSGPDAGINEIYLPEVEPGSSIMPGKVNPSIIEALQMVCYDVIGADLTIALASKSGNLELNVYTPLIAEKLLTSIEIMKNSIEMFNKKCLIGIKANKKRCLELLERSKVYATCLSPYIGYELTAYFIKKAQHENKSIREAILSSGVLSRKDLDKLFSMKKMLKPELIDKNIVKHIKKNKNYNAVLNKINLDKGNKNSGKGNELIKLLKSLYK